MDSLTDDQTRALDQLRDLTNGADDDVAIGVLTSVDWDVQRAIEMIFGAAPQPPLSPLLLPSTTTPRIIETFEIDDSLQPDHNDEPRRVQPPRNVSQWPSVVTFYARPIFSVLAIPIHILSNIIRFIFNVLRIPVPQFRFSGLNFYRPLNRPSRPSSNGGPDRWLRELEEDTGAVSIGRLKLPRSATASGLQSGPSSVSARQTQSTVAADDDRKLLPDFALGSYDETIRYCQQEVKICCVILVSQEHDNVAEFKRTTLTDTTFVKTLYDNDIVVWGGDVRDKDAWSAAAKLQATTYPFVAFLALQPRRGTPSSSSRSNASSSASHTFTVLSRHQGPPHPSPTAPTSAPFLLDHLNRQVLPRVTPFLERLRNAKRERDLERRLREDQDRAFQESARRDKERIEAKIAAERLEIEGRRLAEEAALAERIQRERDAEALRRRESVRMDWRRWARKTLFPPTLADIKGSLRIAIRLPNGTRTIHNFSPTATLTSLYAFVDTQLIPPHLDAEHDPSTPPVGSGIGEQMLEKYMLPTSTDPTDPWGFKVVLAYPRMEIPWKADVWLSEINHLKGGGQVVVEISNDSRRSSTERLSNNGSGSLQNGDHVEEDDGYDTEESE